MKQYDDFRCFFSSSVEFHAIGKSFNGLHTPTIFGWCIHTRSPPINRFGTLFAVREFIHIFIFRTYDRFFYFLQRKIQSWSFFYCISNCLANTNRKFQLHYNAWMISNDHQTVLCAQYFCFFLQKLKYSI